MAELFHTYGFYNSIYGSINFYSRKTLFYLSGRMGVFHKLENNSQKFFPILNQLDFTAAAVEDHYLVLASKKPKTMVVVYDLKSDEKKTMPQPKISYRHEYVCVAMSSDCQFVAAQSGTSNLLFVLWDWKEKKLKATFEPVHLKRGACITEFSFNPSNPFQVITLGWYILRLYQYLEGGKFSEHPFYEQENSLQKFTSLVWQEQCDHFAVGTSSGIILIFKGQQLIEKINVFNKMPEIYRLHKEGMQVSCLLNSKNGLICTCAGKVVLIINRDADLQDFQVSGLIALPEQQSDVDERIDRMILNPTKQILVATTNYGQILLYSLSDHLDTAIAVQYFGYILKHQHQEEIKCMDLAVWKPYLVTCSSSAVILWDYFKGEELLVSFPVEEICSVAIHPLGYTLLIGFVEKAKLFHIIDKSLIEITTVYSADNTQVSFSTGGHLFAVCNSNIDVYYTLNVIKLKSFKGHKGKIQSLVWKDDDTRLLSCDDQGKISEWDIISKKEIWTSVTPNQGYSFLILHSDGFLVSTLDNKIKLYSKTLIELKVDPEVSAMFKQCSAMFSTKSSLFIGTSNGCIRKLMLPLSKGCATSDKFCHQRRITNLKLSKDGKLLIVAGVDGMLSMWKVTDAEDSKTFFTEEILAEKEVLDKNVEQINCLQFEFDRLAVGYEIKFKMQAEEHKNQIAEAAQKYDDILQKLRQRIIQQYEEKHNIVNQKENLKVETVRTISKEREENLIATQEKLEKVHDRYEQLKIEQAEIERNYEQKIDEMKKSHELLLTSMKQDCEEKVSALQNELGKEPEFHDKPISNEYYQEVKEEVAAKASQLQSNFMIDFQLYKNENLQLLAPLKILDQKLSYETESYNALDAILKEQVKEYEMLNDVQRQIEIKTEGVKNSIHKVDCIINERADMIHTLDEESLDREGQIKFFKRLMEIRSGELSEKKSCTFAFEDELKELQNTKTAISSQLDEGRKKSESLMRKIKNSKAQLDDYNSKLINSQLVLEKYRSELISHTKGIENQKKLKFALLKVYEKHVRQAKTTKGEENSGKDIYAKFHRMRDHYAAQTDTVCKRIQQSKSLFNKKCHKQMQEKADRIRRLNDLKGILKRKQDRIHCLEIAAGIPAKDFSLDPETTRQAVEETFKRCSALQAKEAAEIAEKSELINVQEKELQRLHSALVVSEDGKIVHDMKSEL